MAVGVLAGGSESGWSDGNGVIVMVCWTWVRGELRRRRTVMFASET